MRLLPLMLALLLLLLECRKLLWSWLGKVSLRLLGVELTQFINEEFSGVLFALRSADIVGIHNRHSLLRYGQTFGTATICESCVKNK